MNGENDIRPLIREAVGTGEFIRVSLEHVALDERFSLRDLMQRGAISADVEYGQEAYALLPLHPKFIIISEPKSPDFDREDQIKKTLATIQNPLIIVKRLSSLKILEEIQKQGRYKNVGLITWLNIFPDWINPGPDPLIKFGNQAEKLLGRNGRVIMSFVEYDDYRHKLIDTVVSSGISGLGLKKIEQPVQFAGAGRLLLIGKKL